jgi:tetratricopeptide (TPR) repeat protein
MRFLGCFNQAKGQKRVLLNRDKSRSCRWAKYVFLAFVVFVDHPIWAQTVEEFQRQATELTSEYRFQEAIDLLRDTLRQHPDDQRLLQQLGNLLVATGRLEEGEALLQRVSAADHRPDVLQSLAESHLRRNQLQAAISLLNDVLWHRPGDAEAHRRLAFALFLGQEPVRAEQHSRQAVEQDPLNPAHRNFLAVLLDVNGKKEESYRQLKEVQRLAPRDASIWFRLSEKERLAAHFEQARASLQEAIRLDPENPLYHSALSQVCEQLGQRDCALHEAARADQLSQAFETYTKALELAASGRNSEATGLLVPFVEKHPEFVTGARCLARLYAQLGDKQGALRIYTRLAVHEAPESASRGEAAWILAENGDLSSALQLLNDTPDNPNRSLFEAYRQAQAGNYDAALGHLRQAEGRHPLNSQLLRWISFCLRAQGKKPEALKVLEKIERLRPGDSSIDEERRLIQREIVEERAGDLVRADRWQEAVSAYVELAALEGSRPSARPVLNLAYCHQQVGNSDQAIAQYRAGLRLDPSATWARTNLAGLLQSQRRYLEAAREWEKIPGEFKTQPVLFQLGLCYLHVGRPEKAEQVLQAAQKHGKLTPELLYHLGMARRLQLKPSTAMRP